MADSVRLGFVVMATTSFVYTRSIAFTTAVMVLIGFVGQHRHHKDDAMREALELLVNFLFALLGTVIFFVVLKRRSVESLLQQDLLLMNIHPTKRTVARAVSGILILLLLFAAWERVGYWRGVSWIYVSCLMTLCIFGAAFLYDSAVNEHFGDSEYRIFKRRNAVTHCQLAYFLVLVATIRASLDQTLEQSLWLIPVQLLLATLLTQSLGWFKPGKVEKLT